jgi:hypothetical protein
MQFFEFFYVFKRSRAGLLRRSIWVVVVGFGLAVLVLFFRGGGGLR